MDSEELNLHSKLVEAEYEYMNYLRDKKLPEFTKETQNYVWDKTHWYYKYIFPEKNDNCDLNDCCDSNDCCGSNQNNDAKLQKKLYKKLTLICHPDKCEKSWAIDVFKLINEANQCNDLDLLKKLNNHWDTYKNFENYQIIEKEIFIKKCKLELWYLWSHPGYSCLKEMFFDIQQYNKLQKI